MIFIIFNKRDDQTFDEQKLRRTHPVTIYFKNIFDSLIQFLKPSTKNELFNLSKTSTLGKI